MNLDLVALFGSEEIALKCLLTERDYLNENDLARTQKTYDSMDVTGDGGKTFHKCKDFKLEDHLPHLPYTTKILEAAKTLKGFFSYHQLFRSFEQYMH